MGFFHLAIAILPYFLNYLYIINIIIMSRIRWLIQKGNKSFFKYLKFIQHKSDLPV